jgi:hypothetical protein
MEAFVNERSLQSQFVDLADFALALSRLNRILLRLSEAPVAKELFFDRQLYHSFGLPDRIFGSCLEHVTDKSARLQFKLLLRERLAGKEWRLERLHPECSYVCNDQEVTGSSVAEAAERTLLERIVVLLNFHPSTFGMDRKAAVLKQVETRIVVNSINSEGDLDEWYQEFPELGLARYNPAWDRPPRDAETALADRGRFNRTNYRNQGRVIYLDRRTKMYMCVDNFHQYGGHLEVFNAIGVHVGQADLNANIDFTAADGMKALNM